MYQVLKFLCGPLLSKFLDPLSQRKSEWFGFCYFLVKNKNSVLVANCTSFSVTTVRTRAHWCFDQSAVFKGSGVDQLLQAGVFSQISEKKTNQNVLLWVFNNGSEISNLIPKFSFKNDNKNVLSARFFIPTKLANFAPLRYSTGNQSVIWEFVWSWNSIQNNRRFSAENTLKPK